MWLIIFTIIIICSIGYMKYLVKLKTVFRFLKRGIEYYKSIPQKEILFKTEFCYKIVLSSSCSLFIPFHPELEYRRHRTFFVGDKELEIPEDYPLYCTPRQLGFTHLILKDANGKVTRKIKIDELIDDKIYLPDIDPYSQSNKNENKDDPYTVSPVVREDDAETYEDPYQ